jgi:mannose-6-phosphate isomerase-like protein (cupin superfamily)
MVIAFNQTTVATQQIDPGVVRQRLLPNERANDTRVLLDRLTLAPGTTARFDVPAMSLAWLQLLEGEAILTAVYRRRLSDNHSALLPPGFNATLTTNKGGACLLYAELPDAARFDPGFSAEPPLLTVLDWTREPVLKSKHDARKRVSLVGPEMCRTDAMRIQMVIYPPGSAGLDCHHSADAAIYIVSGRGTAWGTAGSIAVHQGDLIYVPERKKHHLQAADNSEMRFLTFYVPGKFETVWTDPSKVSAWVSTGLNINGGETAQDARERHVRQQSSV